MTSSVHQAREALGHELRDIRRDAGLTGVQLAALADWHSSKVSKIEYGKQTPTEEDIHTWCDHTGAVDRVPGLITAVRHIEAMYVEWKRTLGGGTKRRQHAQRVLESRTRLMRWYEPLLIPGILHTPEYASAVLRRVIDFYEISDDLAAGVAERVQRQQILYTGGHRFHFVVAQQALTTSVGGPGVMRGQLDRLLVVMALPRVTFGIVPAQAEYRVPTNQFILYDDDRVQVETISAELTINQPREVALYINAFGEIARQAVYGQAAQALVRAAIERLGEQ